MGPASSISFNLPNSTTLCSRYCSYSTFISEETETQRGWGTCPRSHCSWGSWPKQFDSGFQAILHILNCSPELGFRKVKGYVKDHRSGKYRTRAKTHSSHWIILEACGGLRPVSIRSQCTLISDIPLTLCESVPLPQAISQCCICTSSMATTAQVGERSSAPLPPNPHPVSRP